MIYLRDIRKLRHMTMKELGEKVDLSESAIYMYETGKRKPNYEMLLKLSEELDCTVNDLLYGWRSKEQWENIDTIVEMSNDVFAEMLDNIPMETTKKLFNSLKGATPEQIEQAIKVIEALR